MLEKRTLYSKCIFLRYYFCCIVMQRKFISDENCICVKNQLLEITFSGKDVSSRQIDHMDAKTATVNSCLKKQGLKDITARDVSR